MDVIHDGRPGKESSVTWDKHRKSGPIVTGKIGYKLHASKEGKRASDKSNCQRRSMVPA
jgi:hypothetical protein